MENTESYLCDRGTSCDHAYLLSFLLELFDSSFVDSAAFVDQVSSGSGLARIYMTDNDNVDMDLFLSHCVRCEIILDEMFLKNQ